MATHILPKFDATMLNEVWNANRNKAEHSKINKCAKSIKATLAAMCGIHIHTQSATKKTDIEIMAEEKYAQLLQVFKTAYPSAAVTPFLNFATMKRIKSMDGSSVYRLSQKVRCTMVNDLNVLW